LADVKARRRGEKTLSYYEAVLTKQFLPFCLKAGVTDLGSIDQKLINLWTTDLGERRPKASPNAKARTGKLSVSTVDSYERTVNQFLRWARVVAREITGEVRAQRPNIPQLSRRVLEGADVELMEGATDSERDKLIINVLWQTGMRASELTGLTTDDLIEGSDRSYFLHVKGKAGHERDVPIQPALYRRLRRFAEKRSVEKRDRPELWLGSRGDEGHG
jgi:site-specific recombinase XerD